jgi:hypothetical protein
MVRLKTASLLHGNKVSKLIEIQIQIPNSKGEAQYNVGSQ